MKRRNLFKAAAACALLPALTAFRWPFAKDDERDTLLIAGSDSMLQLVKVLVSSYGKSHPLLDIAVEGGGSALGYQALVRGAIDVATMSRDLNDPEDINWVRTFPIARDALAIVCHKDNPVESLKPKAIADLFLGKITNWKDVGGPDLPVVLVTSPKDSPRYDNLQRMVIDGFDTPKNAQVAVTPVDVIQAVTSNPGAISFTQLKDLDPQIKVLKVDGVAMSKASVLSGRYAYSRPYFLTLYREDNDKAQAFIDFATGPAGQKIIEEQGFIPVR